MASRLSSLEFIFASELYRPERDPWFIVSIPLSFGKIHALFFFFFDWLIYMVENMEKTSSKKKMLPIKIFIRGEFWGKIAQIRWKRSNEMQLFEDGCKEIVHLENVSSRSKKMKIDM